MCYEHCHCLQDVQEVHHYVGILYDILLCLDWMDLTGVNMNRLNAISFGAILSTHPALQNLQLKY